MRIVPDSAHQTAREPILLPPSNADQRVVSPILTGEEVVQARRYLEAFREAEAGDSTSIQVDGYLIAYPLVEKAQRVIDLATAIERTARGET